MLVVERFLRCINAYLGLEADVFAIGPVGTHLHYTLGRKFLDDRRQTGDFINLLAGEPKRFRVLPVDKLQGQHAHAHEIRTVNALIAFSNDGAHTQQAWALSRPIARGTGAVLFAGKDDERHAFRQVLFGGIEYRHLLAIGRWRVKPPSRLGTILLRRRTLAKVPRTMTS